MTHRNCARILLVTVALTVAACGGGGGGSSGFVGSTPPPPPPPTAPIPPEHIGLVSSAPFAVQAASDQSLVDVQFSYNASNNSYQISLPGFQPGSLANIGYNGSAGQIATSTTSQVTEGSSNTLQPVFVFLPVPGSSFSPYTYTSFGSWDQATGVGNASGNFAYGIPTAVGDVPVTGSASYTAEIRASSDLVSDYMVGGSASLQFNFAAGTLSGSMHPEIVDGFNGVFVDFGQFDFTQTVYSTGSTTFSGKFIVPGLPGADSSFNGNFTGPNAAELMARFVTDARLNGHEGTLSGVWVGKKNP